MILTAAFNCLMHYCTAQTDIVVGTDVANRNSPETEKLIGFFINQVPLRSNLAGNPRFRELLAQVRRVALHAFAHQELPFDRIVTALGLQRSAQGMPIFQVKIVLENTPASELKLPELNITPLEFRNVAAKLDLTLLLQENLEGIHGWFEYNLDLFEAETISIMGNLFQELLSAVVVNPESRLEELMRSLEKFEKKIKGYREGEERAEIEIESI